jgi:transposase
MSSQETYTRTYIIKAACEGLFTVQEAAERLKIGTRQVKQLKAAYRKVGDDAFVHGNKGRTPVNKISTTVREKIVEMKLSSPYQRQTLLTSRRF